jgi:hypothetical protein
MAAGAWRSEKEEQRRCGEGKMMTTTEKPKWRREKNRYET